MKFGHPLLESLAQANLHVKGVRHAGEETNEYDFTRFRIRPHDRPALARELPIARAGDDLVAGFDATLYC